MLDTSDTIYKEKNGVRVEGRCLKGVYVVGVSLFGTQASTVVSERHYDGTPGERGQ